MPKRFLLVAHDIAPSRCFTLLQPILTERGFAVDMFVGKQTDTTKLPNLVSSADIVLLGMSSAPALSKVELAAGAAARKLQIPYAFYGDVRRCWARARPGAWFENLASDTALYLGIDQADANDARVVFPSARLVGSGNPLREKMAFPRYTRLEVRERLNITPNDVLILAPGGKFPAGNIALWSLVMEALKVLSSHRKLHFELVLSPHPGDRGPYAQDSESGDAMVLYEQLARYSPVPTRVLLGHDLSGSDLVPGADIVVEHGGSIGMEAAYQRIPVINPDVEILSRRYEEIAGTRSLETIVDGVAIATSPSPFILARTIEKLLTQEGFAELRSKQVTMYPKPNKPGHALQLIADALISMAT